jgi:tetratricopeptide (TPR) repeat protein
MIYKQLAVAAIVFSAAALSPSPSSAQITIGQITGGAVEENADQYREIGDATVLFQRGNGTAALKMFQDISKSHPELPPGEVMFAHLCFASQNEKPGRAALQSAVVVHARDPEAWNMLADLQLREGHLAEAEVLFERARSIADSFEGAKRRQKMQSINALAGLARTYELRKLWGQAETCLQQWQSVDAENPGVFRRLAAAQLNLGKYDEARATLEQLRKIDPEQLPAEVTLGTIYQSLGKNEQAAEIMKSALQKYGDDFDTRIAVARWALDAGDLAQARASATYAATLNNDSFLPTLLLATADLLEGDFKRAEQQFRAVYDKKPGNFDAINGLSVALFAQNNQERLQQGLELARVNARTYRDMRTAQGRQAVALLAWGLHLNGSDDEALKLIQPVIASGQISADIAYYAANIILKQGKKNLAIELLNKSLESEGRFVFRADAQRLLKSLQSS